MIPNVTPYTPSPQMPPTDQTNTQDEQALALVLAAVTLAVAALAEAVSKVDVSNPANNPGTNVPANPNPQQPIVGGQVAPVTPTSDTDTETKIKEQLLLQQLEIDFEGSNPISA